MAKELPKSTRRLGSRYGRRVRLRLGLIEKSQRAEYKCPYCSAKKVKRVSVGIWECKKCGSKFTGKAYKV